MEKDSVTEADKIQISELLEDLRRSNAALRTETEMLESYVSRLDPRALGPQAVSESSGSVPSMEMGPYSGRRRDSKARRPSQERSQVLTLEQKCGIAEREMEEMRDNLEKLRESSERVLDNYKATIEEADIRLVEVRKASYEFDRDVAKTLKKQGVRMDAEKVTRYIRNRVKAKETLIQRLRLKNMVLRTQKHKLQLQLRHKEEMGEALHKVDFQQLKTKNRQYLEQIDKLNQDLLRLKLQDGNTLQVCNHYKKELQILTLQSEALSSDIVSREDMLKKIEKETQQTEKERAKAEARNRKLRAQLAEFRVPDVLSYVKVKATHTKLEESVRAWERKVAIAEMEFKTLSKAWNKRRAAAGAALAHI
ncbi:cilia- and flagella-associated protein 263 [Salminus brasiliensis]|uniref:cilia- and flagella-associated protein 263 n=1 Tax=Salminus brasiliensis TaxID=930266 RepID=UPI003B82E887